MSSRPDNLANEPEDIGPQQPAAPSCEKCGGSTELTRVVPGLGVQSRSEVGWIVSESPGLVCPSFADVLVGREAPQRLEALSEVVGVEEGFEVLSELLVGLVVIARRWLP